MSEKRKPQRAFLTVTLMTVLAVTMVFMVYAALLATYTGLNVVVTEPGGTIQYNKYNDNNGTWASQLDIINGTTWYARITFTDPGTQTVTIEWTLLEGGNPTANSINSTDIALSPGDNIVYSATTGKFADLYNWGQHTSAQGSAGTYQIQAKVYG